MKSCIDIQLFIFQTDIVWCLLSNPFFSFFSRAYYQIQVHSLKSFTSCRSRSFVTKKIGNNNQMREALGLAFLLVLHKIYLLSNTCGESWLGTLGANNRNMLPEHCMSMRLMSIKYQANYVLKAYLNEYIKKGRRKPLTGANRLQNFQMTVMSSYKKEKDSDVCRNKF